MKILKLHACAIVMVAMLFTSCSGDESNVIQLEGESASISLKIVGATSTKAMDPNTVDADNVINDLVVFITRNDGTFDVAPQYFVSTSIVGGALPKIAATTRAASVYIVCNTGPFATGPFSGVANIDQVARKALAVDGNPNTASNCKPHNVWMSGNNVLTPAGDDTDNKPKFTSTVLLEYIPAKIYVTVNNQMTNYSPTANTLLDGLMVVNGGAWTRFVKEGLGIQTYQPQRTDITSANNVPFYYNGLNVDATPYTDRPSDVNGFADYVVKAMMNRPHAFASGESVEWSDLSADNPGTQFYVFPDITNNNTYVTLYGRYATTGASPLTTPNIFWPVSFGGSDNLFSSIQSGKKYLVTITLTGDAGSGSGGGDDPTEDVVDANVYITVTPAEWNVEIKEKVFQ